MNPKTILSNIFKVWKGVASHDERGGNIQTVGYYVNRSDAESDVRKQGFYGSDGVVQREPVEVVEVDVNGEKMIFPLSSRIKVFYEDREKRQAKTELNRKNGLAKLTTEERIALGLEK